MLIITSNLIQSILDHQNDQELARDFNACICVSIMCDYMYANAFIVEG